MQITGSNQPENNDERRRATASRITYGREELDRMGDSTLGEVLKRLPGVTLSGPPGRGGQVRMRGMGGGYTQILIDGQRMAPGFSLDSIAPDQIERIEILRAPVAEYGTRAIAGTINVILRSDFKRRAHEFRVGGGTDGGRGQVGASYLFNGQTDDLGYNVNATVFQGGQGDESDTRTLARDATGSTTLDQSVHSQSESRRKGLFGNGRLQIKFGPGNTLDLQPFFNAVQTRSTGQATLSQAVHIPTGPADTGLAPYNQATWQSQSKWQMGRLNGTWLAGTPGGGRLQLRFGSTLSQSSSLTERDETGGTANLPGANLPGANLPGTGGRLTGRHKVDDVHARELSLDLNGKYSQLLAERHSAAAGWELQRSQRDDGRKSFVNNQPSLAEFGETITATTQRIALYGQDEWDWSPTFSFYAGARWEAITTASASAIDRVHNRSAVFTPLAHMVWKLPNSSAEKPDGAPNSAPSSPSTSPSSSQSRDQIRASLTRSYRSPNTNQLVARPAISSLFADLGQTNSPTSPDRVGNPRLLPELAWGLEVGFEHYLDAGGIVSANLFARRIDNLIRTVRSLETVSYATAPRWVARPTNIGQADAAGLELEAKARLGDLWETDLPITLRSNFSVLWSYVNQVSGANNRLEGQPPYTANLGADWPLRGTPLTVGANLNFTPGFALTQIDNQTYRQGVKRVIDANAVWRFSPDASLRLTISNAAAQRYDTGSSTTLLDATGNPASTESADTSARSYTTVNLRGEFRF